MSGFFEKGESSQSATRDVTIPEFLRPFLEQGAGTASGALGSLRRLSGGDLVAGFTPAQRQAQQQAIELAGGAGGFLPTAQNTFLQAARGQGLNSFLPDIALDEFGNAIDAEFLPAESRAALTEFGTGAGALPGTEALQRTAGGDFLFGGEGFDQAVQAAVRAARPGILSTFGSAGAGGATGGLAQSAIGQSAVDAFARQFAQERQNQLGAAGQLANLGLAGRGQQLGALGQLAGVNQAQAGLGLNAAGLLGDFGNAERQRQLAAAGVLPDIATAGINLLSGVGGQQQALAQQQLSAPMQAQLQLLSAALGGLPIPSLLGGTQTGESDFSGFHLNFGDQG